MQPEQGLGRHGMASVKLENFKEIYEWQLEEYGHQRKNTILGLSLKEYYELGCFCINNKISITGFIKSAVKERKFLCERGLLDVHQDNSHTLSNSIKKQNTKIKKQEVENDRLQF